MTSSSTTSPARWFADRSVGTKVTAAVLSAAAVAAAVGAVSVSKVRTLSHSGQAIYQEGAVTLQQLGAVNLAQDDARRELLNVLVSATPADVADNTGDVRDADERFRTSLDAYRAHAREQGGERGETAERAQEAWDRYAAVRDGKLLPLATRHDVAGFSAAHSAEARRCRRRSRRRSPSCCRSRTPRPRPTGTRSSTPSAPPCAPSSRCCCSGWWWLSPSPRTWRGWSRARWPGCPRC